MGPDFQPMLDTAVRQPPKCWLMEAECVCLKFPLSPPPAALSSCWGPRLPATQPRVGTPSGAVRAPSVVWGLALGVLSRFTLAVTRAPRHMGSVMEAAVFLVDA